MREKSFYVSLIAVALASAGIFLSLVSLSVVKKASDSLGTDLTINSNTNSYTDGADFRQNVQAIAERMAGLSQYQILQADSQGRMQAVAPSALAGATWDFDGARIASLVRAGDVSTYTATSSVTAAEFCDSTHLQMTPASSTPTLTLPATTTLFADCLTENGDAVDLSVTTINTSTILAVGAGGTLDVSSSTLLLADTSGIIRIIRDTATSYLAILLNADQ